MNTATPIPWPALLPEQNANTTFRAIFDRAPVAAARCNAQGMIVEMNPAFELGLDRGVARGRLLCLGELIRPQDRDKTEALLGDLFDSRCESVGIETGGGPGQRSAKWIAWRQSGCGGEANHALLIADRVQEKAADEGRTPAESLIQSQRWEAVGRLAGGVVHDFNNLLTGVMLYCDLLLSSLDGRDRRRRYVDEIRSAIVQAAGLVRQLLVFARPRAEPARPLCLNEIAIAMRDLLARLIGENITLEFNLDPDLGAVSIDQAQAQQILLNLILNARDALPKSGRITLETSNCKFQTLAGTKAPVGSPAFSCVMLVVGDNGHGMNAETRQRLFEPFFTTKNSGQGSGLGLTTVHSIVTANRGLIQFDSEPGRGTRVLVLFPRATCSPDPSPELSPKLSPKPRVPDDDTVRPSATPLHEIKKESRL